MTRLIFIFILNSFIILLIPHCLKAQTPKDTVRTNGIRLGFDVGGFALGLAKVTNQKIEFSGDVGYKKSFLVAEMGFMQKSDKKDIYNYKQQGFYTRLGIEKNMLKGDDALFFGLRYAVSFQKFEIDDILIKDPYWGNLSQGGIPVRSFSLHWVEGVTGLKVKIWDNFFMGYTIRLKFKIYTSDLSAYPPFTLLGYGKTDKSTQVGLSYFVYYRIPFKAKKVPKP